jgi:hypothetical protein
MYCDKCSVHLIRKMHNLVPSMLQCGMSVRMHAVCDTLNIKILCSFTLYTICYYMQQEGLDLPMEVIRSVILRNPDVLLLSGAAPAVTVTSKTAKPVPATATASTVTATTAKKRKLRSAGASDASELHISALSFTELKSSRLARTVSVPIGPLVTVGILVHYGKLKQSVAVKLIIQMPDIFTMPQGNVLIYHVYSIALYILCCCRFDTLVYCTWLQCHNDRSFVCAH